MDLEGEVLEEEAMGEKENFTPSSETLNLEEEDNEAIILDNNPLPNLEIRRGNENIPQDENNQACTSQPTPRPESRMQKGSPIQAQATEAHYKVSQMRILQCDREKLGQSRGLMWTPLHRLNMLPLPESVQPNRKGGPYEVTKLKF